MFQTKLADKKSYTASIDKIKLKLAKLQKSNKKAKKILTKSLNRYKNINRVLHY